MPGHPFPGNHTSPGQTNGWHACIGTRSSGSRLTVCLSSPYYLHRIAIIIMYSVRSRLHMYGPRYSSAARTRCACSTGTSYVYRRDLDRLFRRICLLIKLASRPPRFCYYAGVRGKDWSVWESFVCLFHMLPSPPVSCTVPSEKRTSG
jgi:hypothetical protein